jgi:hypothetical protein
MADTIHQWELIDGSGDMGDHSWSTMRLRVPGGWIYMHTVMTALGPHMTSVFVPSNEPNQRTLEDAAWDNVR